jgi:hypothetical protein
MLKAFIATSVSISSLLSITSIADAGSINHQSDHHTNHQTTLNLITKQTKSATGKNKTAVSLSRQVADIRIAIIQYYKEVNDKTTSGAASGFGAGRFVEVKGLKLVSLSGSNATVEAAITARNYDFSKAFTKRIKLNPDKDPNLLNKTDGNENIRLEFTQGKWKVMNPI